jgi:tRNA(fMet)-specific endonuclease VapC
MYLLDTNAVIALLRGDGPFLTRMRAHAPGDFAISAIVGHELYFGAYKGRRTAENLALIERLRFPMLEFDREDAQRAGEIRAALAAAGSAIGPYDVLIAGQALARDMTLVTRNLREFGRVPGLAVENWED